MLGRIRDAIKQIGAQQVFEIGRGVAFPEAYVSSVFGEKDRVERDVQDAIANKVRTQFLTDDDEKKVKKGEISADILEKMGNEQQIRRMLLSNKYGGKRHRKFVE